MNKEAISWALALPDILEFVGHVASQAKGGPKAMWGQARKELTGRQTLEDIRRAWKGVRGPGLRSSLKSYGKGIKEVYTQPGKHPIMSGLAYGIGAPTVGYEAYHALKDPTMGPAERAGTALGDVAALGTYHPEIGFMTAGGLSVAAPSVGGAIGRRIDRALGLGKSASEVFYGAVLACLEKEAVQRPIESVSDQEAEQMGGAPRKVLKKLVAGRPARRDAGESYERSAAIEEDGDVHYRRADRKGGIRAPHDVKDLEKNVHTHPYLGNLRGAREKVKRRVALRLAQIEDDITQAVMPSPADLREWKKLDREAKKPIAHSVLAPHFGLEGIHRYDAGGRLRSTITTRPKRIQEEGK